MPATSEEKPRRRVIKRSVVAEGAEEVVVEKFDYPKEAVVNHDQKSVNLAWYGDRFKRKAGSDTAKYLDYNLATYCVVKELPLLSIQKWSILFMSKDDRPKPRLEEFNDEEVLRVLDKMRTTYLIIHPHKDEEHPDENKNWSNTIKNYIRKMLSNKKTKPVAMLLFMNLLGLRTAIQERKEAWAILGNMVPAHISNEFNQEDEAKYGLVLPPDLLPTYNGKGWSSEDMEWIGKYEGPTIGEQSAQLAEKPEEKSGVFWRYTIAQLEKKKIRLKDVLVAQKNAVVETSEQLSLIRKEQQEASDLENLANQRESLVPKHGTIKEKIEELSRITELKKLLHNTEMDNKKAFEIFSQIRNEAREMDVMIDQPGPSSMVATSRRQKHNSSCSSGKRQEDEMTTAVNPNGKRRKIITAEEVKSSSAEGNQKENGLNTSGANASTEPAPSAEVDTVTEVFLNDSMDVVCGAANNDDEDEDGLVSKEGEDHTIEAGVDDAREIEILNESSQKSDGEITKEVGLADV